MQTTIATISFVLVAMLTAYGCAGDGGSQPQEAVSNDGAPPAVPDAPGDAGETAPKAPGDGSAGEAPAAAEGGAAAAAAPAQAGDLVVAISHLNVRSGPAMSHPVVRVVKEGDVLRPTSCKAGWCQLGPAEFVARRHLKEAAK